MAPPPYIEKFAFGYHEIMADILWLRVIQDFDVCNKPQATKFEDPNHKHFLIADENVNPVSKEIFERLDKADVARKKNCDMSWPYFMMDAATNLSPLFRIVYVTGGVTLSVIVEDFAGASLLFDKGVSQIRDWNLYYRAAYHFLYDVKDYAKAARLLDEAVEMGAPSWVRSLAARLLTLAGQAELAISVLEKYLDTIQDHPKAIEDVEKRINALKKILADEKNK